MPATVIFGPGTVVMSNGPAVIAPGVAMAKRTTDPPVDDAKEYAIAKPVGIDTSFTSGEVTLGWSVYGIPVAVPPGVMPDAWSAAPSNQTAIDTPPPPAIQS